WVVSWDHASGRCWIVSTGIPERGERREARAHERLELVRARLSGVASWWEPCDRSGPRAASSSHTDASMSNDPVPGALAPSYPVEGMPDACEVGLRSSFTHRQYL